MDARAARARRRVRACTAQIVCPVGGAPPAMMSRASLIGYPSPGLLAWLMSACGLWLSLGAPRVSPSAF
ncbi:hypothetical protein A8H37_04215 [Burkholderia thailandensis]|nr:hypothetical protein A8H37_04215 [Burkholderia thailandensis]